MSATDPIISCTQRELAWDAWQKAGNPTLGLIADEDQQRQDFADWWTRYATQRSWPSLRAMIESAWETSERQRRTFESYWQAIVDSQPNEVR